MSCGAPVHIPVHIDEKFSHFANRHPCFSGEANFTRGRIHLPVSPVCNIRCRFCTRAIGVAVGLDGAARPGVASRILAPDEAAEYVGKALKLCPEITVAGIAGPGDTLASGHALETFDRIHRAYPELINCLSTNGLLLERYAADLYRVGVRTVTVTVNAVKAHSLEKICAGVFLDGVSRTGVEGAALLIDAQQRGIRRASELGLLVKVNIVLIPAINGAHIGEIARTVQEAGAALVNIIPLIPQGDFAAEAPPDCDELAQAREAAEQSLPVFRHCQHCRADACGIPGKGDISALLYGGQQFEETFSHG
jgi:nitrogen fixation protein NifB